MAAAFCCILLCQTGTASAQQAPTPPAPASEPAADSETLPAVPTEEAAPPAPAPRSKAPAVVYAPPRVTEKDDQEWRSKRQIKFQRAQKALAVSGAESKELIDAGTHFVDRMTIPKLVGELPLGAIEPIRRAVDFCQPNPKAVLLKAVTDRAVELLAEKPAHPPDVQLGIVILLGTLNAQPGSVNAPPAPYTGSSKALITVLEDTSMPLQCRIAAAIGLGRMGREARERVSLGDLSVVQRNEIATSLAKVLTSSEAQAMDEGHVWFRGRVVEALGDCGEAFDLIKTSVFIDALMTTATNPQETLRVRAAAIRAATQTKWDGQVNFPLILNETVKLSAEIANASNAAIAAKKPIPSELRHANIDIYLAFQPKTDRQANTLYWGLLNQTKRNGLGGNAPAVQTAYAAVLPVVNTILTTGNKLIAVPQNLIAAEQAWIAANPPQNRKATTISPNALP
ncbi:MAG: hypothetical protein U0929_08635 [Planctomycetaceae bacterium]